MPKLVSETEELVPVRVDGDEHTIWIRPRLSFGQQNKVKSAAMMSAGGLNSDDDLVNALMEAFIVRWEGKDFVGVKCNRANIRRLPADDALVTAVGDEVARRWLNQPEPDPNSDPAGLSASPESSTSGTATGQ